MTSELTEGEDSLSFAVLSYRIESGVEEMWMSRLVSFLL